MVWRQGNVPRSGYRENPLKQGTKQERKINGVLVTAASGVQRQAFVPLIISQYCSLPLHPRGSMFHTHPFYHPLCSPFFPHDRGSLYLLLCSTLSRSSLPSSLIWRLLQPFPSINVFCFILPPHYVSSPHPKLLFHIHFQSRLSPWFLLLSTTLVLSASTGSSDLLPPFILSLLSFYLSFITSLFTTAVLSERLT